MLAALTVLVWLAVEATAQFPLWRTSHRPRPERPASKVSARHVAEKPKSPPSTTQRDPQTGPKAIDPAMFSAGACEEFAPTSGNRHLVVFLDAGHGGVDPGAVGTTSAGQTIYESHETLPVELDTMALLRARGFTVVVSRTSNTTVLKLGPTDIANGDLTLQGQLNEVAARDVCANMAHAALLIGIYFDAESSPSYAGCITAYDTARPFASDNQRLANLVQNDVLGAMNAHGWQIPNEGAMSDSALGSIPPSDSYSGLEAETANYDHLLLLGPPEAGYFSTPSQMPGVVVEPLYITDPFEGTIAASSLGQQTIAGGIAKAVEQYFA